MLPVGGELTCTLDTRARIRSAGDAYCRLLGLSAAELVGMAFPVGASPQIQAIVRQSLGTLSPARPSTSVNCHVEPVGKPSRVQHWTLQASFDSQGQPRARCAVGREVTAEQAANEARQRQLAAVTRLALQALAGTDLDELERHISATVSTVLGVGRCELVRTDSAEWHDWLSATSPAARAIALRRTVVVDAANPAVGVEIPPRMVKQGLSATLCVPVRAGKDIWGALAVYATPDHAFDSDAGEFLQDVAEVLGAAVSGNLAQELIRGALTSAFEGIIATDARSRVCCMSLTAEQLSGWTGAEAEGRPLLDIWQARRALDDRPAADPVQSAMQGPQGALRWERLRLMHRDGVRTTIIESAVTAVVDDAGRRLGAVVIFHEMGDPSRLAGQLSYLTTHDGLTGLMNRVELLSSLDQALARARAERRQHVLCYFDLDQFKVVNDSWGHVAGDELLRQIAGLLEDCTQQSGVLARLGGDEFALLLLDCPVEPARRVADRMRRAIASYRFLWENRSLSLTSSIGLAPITRHTTSTTQALSAADAACCVAKEKGRNRIHVSHANDMEMARHRGEIQWVARIQDALTNDGFRLRYQPIVPLGESADAGRHYEILLCMEGPGGELIPPGAFLPAAERYNLMPSIDRWVVRNALSQLTRICRRHPGRILDTYAINLCGASLSDANALDFLRQEIRSQHVLPQMLCFEITETAAVANLPEAIVFMEELKVLGCQFALDDFGSGLSSFAYLRNLPVDFLKIDGRFVKDIAHDAIDRAMVESINSIGHVMGLKTVAEFVEDGAIRATLAEMRVDYAQGFGIARPAPFEELMNLAEED